MPLRNALRTETTDSHATVDDIFSRFDLGNSRDYTAFLRAHARILPAVEAALEQAGIADLLPDWADRRRTDQLAADLADLGIEQPEPLEAPVLKSEAEVWGTMYVIEGSKLGGALLAKSVPANMPSRYLTPTGPKGNMKIFMDRVDAVEIEDSSEAVAAARATFALFRKAAEMELEPSIS
ncbi:biliverdin-producing heme oxygenase [Rhizobium sp. S152]|uniref:biliverdin-producing heme oxygenase n=1 Tax=Rhizobium sp. S152 TaxID=3055038 RepID=UPI0025A9DE1E|nr:biliverdin-producing heme oxygenase [Rhizobium sp. S152]MDM9626011.1 biliverdin-producing heme oxygenase [Rhizobium sp. S152]